MILVLFYMAPPASSNHASGYNNIVITNAAVSLGDRHWPEPFISRESIIAAILLP